MDDGLTPEIQRLFAAKEVRRRALAALPFPEKVAAMVKLQEMAAPLLRARGRAVRPWVLNDTDASYDFVLDSKRPAREQTRFSHSLEKSNSVNR